MSQTFLLFTENGGGGIVKIKSEGEIEVEIEVVVEVDGGKLKYSRKHNV